MGLAVGTAKYLLFFFNFIFFVTGIAIIAVGGVGLNELRKLNHNFSEWESSLSSPAVLLIVVGVFVTIISFFGCCGAIRHSYCMLITFAVLLGIIFILELAGGIAAYVKRDALTDGLEKVFNDTLADVQTNKDDFTWWEEMQNDTACCGIYNYESWDKVAGMSPPGSCCGHISNFSCDAQTLKETMGCYNKTVDFLTTNIVAIGGVGVGIAFVQLLGIVYACCLATAVRDGS